MQLRKRLLLSLAAGVTLAVLLFVALTLSRAEALMWPQYAGLLAIVLTWGPHGGPQAEWVEYAVWVAADTVVYWPILFCASFLVWKKTTPSRL